MPDGKPIKPGSRDPRVRGDRRSAAGRRLRSPPSGGRKRPQRRRTPATTPQLVAAVKQLQGDFGFKPDGIIGGDTLDALNTGPRLPRAPARGGDGAAALAVSAIRRRRGSTSTPPRRSSIIGATASTSISARWSTASRTSRRRSCRRRSSGWWPIRPGPCPDGIAAKELADEEPGLAGGEQFRS